MGLGAHNCQQQLAMRLPGDALWSVCKLFNRAILAVHAQIHLIFAPSQSTVVLCGLLLEHYTLSCVPYR